MSEGPRPRFLQPVRCGTYNGQGRCQVTLAGLDLVFAQPTVFYAFSVFFSQCRRRPLPVVMSGALGGSVLTISGGISSETNG